MGAIRHSIDLYLPAEGQSMSGHHSLSGVVIMGAKDTALAGSPLNLRVTVGDSLTIRFKSAPAKLKDRPGQESSTLSKGA